ncbi:hypothetical protein [Chryseobacterium sp. Bi04]|uniref:hypothetical protein n=1 Tax=Chryseobacterium sp. Bi04 TaxID=2822345 RepID=UPI001DD2D9A5|nr:hypothetical protein [Chryseobacterium sp. Bi04]CAH0168596.1 hypothetical protein SRABI04_01196 [Chryseobacterium sp. Bi04]
MDGIEIKMLFIPTESDKLLIVNHFLDANRYGYPGYKTPNDIVGFEVNQVAQYKTLHDTGYNILAYDLPNHGESESAHDGCGVVECMNTWMLLAMYATPNQEKILLR